MSMLTDVYQEYLERERALKAALSAAEERERVLREALQNVVDGNDLAHARKRTLESWPGSDFRRLAVAALATPHQPAQPSEQKELGSPQEIAREMEDLRTRYEELERENVALKEQVARLSAPVSDAVREDVCKILADAEIQGGSFFLTATRIINFLASRTAPAKTHP